MSLPVGREIAQVGYVHLAVEVGVAGEGELDQNAGQVD
jgi:hypothetical protein